MGTFSKFSYTSHILKSDRVTKVNTYDVQLSIMPELALRGNVWGDWEQHHHMNDFIQMGH